MGVAGWRSGATRGGCSASRVTASSLLLGCWANLVSRVACFFGKRRQIPQLQPWSMTYSPDVGWTSKLGKGSPLKSNTCFYCSTGNMILAFLKRAKLKLVESRPMCFQGDPTGHQWDPLSRPGWLVTRYGTSEFKPNIGHFQIRQVGRNSALPVPMKHGFYLASLVPQKQWPV